MFIPPQIFFALLTKAELEQKVLQHVKAARKVIKVIRSCETYPQLVVAKRMFLEQVNNGNLAKGQVDYIDQEYAIKLAQLSKGEK